MARPARVSLEAMLYLKALGAKEMLCYKGALKMEAKWRINLVKI